MNKTIKMSSFLLTLGLGCMLLYVVLNIFNIPLREGLKGKKESEGPSEEEIEKATEAANATAKGYKKYFKKRENEWHDSVKNTLYKTRILNDATNSLLATWVKQTLEQEKFHFGTFIANPAHCGANGLTKKGVAQVQKIKAMEDAIKILEGAGGADTNSAASAAMSGF